MRRFVKFLKEYRIVSISAAFIVGIVAFNLVQSFVNDVLLPIIRPLISNNAATWEEIIVTVGSINIRLGSFLSAAFSFLLVVVIIYIFIDKILKWKPKK